jgi:hypothetical protein
VTEQDPDRAQVPAWCQVGHRDRAPGETLAIGHELVPVDIAFVSRGGWASAASRGVGRG